MREEIKDDVLIEDFEDAAMWNAGNELLKNKSKGAGKGAGEAGGAAAAPLGVPTAAL